MENTTRIFQILGSGSKKYKPKFVVDTATNTVPLLLAAPLSTYQMWGSSSTVTEATEETYVPELGSEFSRRPSAVQSTRTSESHDHQSGLLEQVYYG